MFDCLHRYYILLMSKINGSADLLELGSQVIIFSAVCFPDVAVGSVDPAWAADTMRSAARGAAGMEKAVILSVVVVVGCNMNCRKAFLANDF